jgi:hypothetical protein
MIPYFKMFAIIIPAVSSALCAGLFTFSKDSIIEKDLSGKPDSVIMTNAQNDTLRIDSVTMLFDTTQMPECEIQFLVMPAAPIRSMIYQYWYGSPNQYNHLTLNPNESVKLSDVAFDLCIQCPVSGFAKVQSRVGDTIRAALVLTVKNFKDTLKIIGKRSVGSTAVYSNPPAKISVHPVTSKSSFDPMGRWIGKTNGTGCFVDKNAKRIMMPKNGKYGASGDR